jgi:hypothetical protein
MLNFDTYDCLGAAAEVYTPLMKLKDSIMENNGESFVEALDDVVFHGSLAVNLCFDTVTPLVDFDK